MAVAELPASESAQKRTVIGQFVDLLRTFPRQARLALGTRGMAWAAAAGLVGLLCCVASLVDIGLSLQDAGVTRRRLDAARLMTLDQGTRTLVRTINLINYGRRPPAESVPALRQAWSGFEAALGEACSGSAAVSRPNPESVQDVCAVARTMHEMLAPEIDRFDPPARAIAPTILAQATSLFGDFNEARTKVVRETDALVDRTVSDYGNALLVLALSTTGFAAAGLVLILLVGRASMQHFRQWRAAADAADAATQARDLLHETLEAVPAGIVVYDQEERLMLFNSAAAQVNRVLAEPGAVGKTYQQLSQEIAARLEAEGHGPQPVASWLARFRKRGRERSPLPVGGRWFEYSERQTASGRIVGLRTDVTDLKSRELELEGAHGRYQALVASLSDVVYELDVEKGTFSFVSAGVVDLLGVPPEKFVGSHFLDYVTPDTRDQVTRFTTRPYASDDRQTFSRFRMTTATGEVRDVEVRARRRLDEDGRLISVGVMRDIGERVRLERRLAEEVARLRAMFETGGAMIALLDRELRYVMVNREFTRVSGLKPEQVIGRTIKEVFGREQLDQATLKRWLAGPLPSDHAELMRYTMLAGDPGSRQRTFNVTANPVTDEKGMVQQIVFLVVDDTDRREALERLRKQIAEVEQARAEYEALVDSLGDLVVKVDAGSGVISFASAAAFDVWGMPASELVGRRVFDFVAPADAERVMREAQAMLKSPSGIKQLQYRARAGNGEERHVEARFRWMPGPAGKPAIVAVTRDVEQRVQLERRLAEEMARLRSVFDTGGAVMALLDRDLRYLMVNQDFLDAVGLPEEKVVGHTVKEVLGTVQLDLRMIDRWKSEPLPPDHDEVMRYTRTFRDASGRPRYFPTTVKPIVDKQGHLQQILLLAVDETERRATEQELFDAERLTIVGEMAATLAHEISQPLQVINISCASAADELAQAARSGTSVDIEFMERRIGRIAQQVDRATRIVGELRAFVRGTGDEQAVPFDPALAVRGAVDLTSHGVEQAQGALTTAVAPRLPSVSGHVGRLEQVLVNLINNARDAGAAAIQVSAGPLQREGRDLVRIAVDDNGPGIAPHVLPRLFDSLVTTKPRGKGTGLGLRICRRIVEEMGGTISAANRPEGGACFQILLPALPAG